MSRIETIAEGVTLHLGDSREILPAISGAFDVVVTDAPYGMKKGEWDKIDPEWLSLVPDIPVACFCGVAGLRNYPKDTSWVGAWVRAGSVQRIGHLYGFNNWEPILFYNLKRLDNDVISTPNLHEDTGHPTTKPLPLMLRLVEKMPVGRVCDPFMGSGTTGVAAVLLGREFIGIERVPDYFDIACRRIAEATKQQDLFIEKPKPAKQGAML